MIASAFHVCARDELRSLSVFSLNRIVSEKGRKINKNLKMTSTFMTTTTSVNYGAYNRPSETNFQNFSTYGLNYYNDSGAEYSDGYQSSISPIASPELNSCRIKNNFHQFNQNDFCYYQNFTTPQIKSENFQEIQNFKSPQKISKPHLSAGAKKIIEINPNNLNKPIIVAPEILKKRRVAANARERRRMNSLNFAFDK